MVFAYDTEVGLSAAVALINTAGPPDTLRTLDDLDEFYDAYQFTGRYGRTAQELREVRVIRPVLRRLLTSVDDESVKIGRAHV